jgi:hypothetical protein
MTPENLLHRIRIHLGDPAESFRTSALGDGGTRWFDLPKQNISSEGFTVTIIDGATVTDLLPTEYTLDNQIGELTLDEPVPDGATLLVTGTAFALFTDEDLLEFINDAVHQHCSGREITQRYKGSTGSIKYREIPMDLGNLPEYEEPMLALLATIEVLWSLSTDASTDVDVVTAEGTHVYRSQRWAQLRSQIDTLQAKYEHLCAQFNVGLYRIEVSTLRRVSRTTGRLVPIFRPREYDDHSLPQRELPPRDHRNDDDSGVPSPLWPTAWG